MIIEILFIVLVLILIICIGLLFIALFNNNLYNSIFNKKERKTWKFLIRNADKFNYIGSHEIGKAFRWGDYLAIIWFNNTCSIHIDTPTIKKCIGTHTDKTMSNRMKDLLLTKIK